MNFIPQMSPIYWLFVSLFCYFSFVLMLIFVNSFFLYLDAGVELTGFYLFKVNWKWLW